MTEKYSGCNIVESKVTTKPHEEPKPRKSGERRMVGFLIRIAIAAVLIGGILALHYLQLPFLDGVRSAVKSVFCYDVFGRSAFGTSLYFG